MKPGDALCIIECDGGSYLFVPGHQDGPLQLITNVRPIPSERITSIAKAVQECAYSWEPTARILGNISAEDVADLCSAVLQCPVESDGLSDLSVYSYDAGESVRISRMGESALWCITTHGVIPDWWFNLGMHYDFVSAGAAFAAIKLAQQAVKQSGQVAAVEICHARKDGGCDWDQCPQLRDGEPAATRRSCPLPLDPDDIERAELDALRRALEARQVKAAPAAAPAPTALGPNPLWITQKSPGANQGFANCLPTRARPSILIFCPLATTGRDQADRLAAQLDFEFITGLEIEHGGVSLADHQVAIELHLGPKAELAPRGCFATHLAGTSKINPLSVEERFLTRREVEAFAAISLGGDVAASPNKVGFADVAQLLDLGH